MESEDCGGLIKDTWEKAEKIGAGLVKKLKTVLEVPESWSKKRFPNSQKLIQKLKSELKVITNEQHLDQNTNRKKDIQDQIKNLWRIEQMYWGLRLRINWLKWGDKNTKFFHATTIQRRQRNRISMLKLAGREI